jgi:prolyl-tRNA synthetase
MVLAESGEDAIVSCSGCEYAANVEKAELAAGTLSFSEPQAELAKVPTPGRRTIEEVAAFLQVRVDRLVKTLIVQTDGGEILAVLLRGDHELNDIKLCRLLGCNEVQLADDETVSRATGAPVGFAGPVGAQTAGAGRPGRGRHGRFHHRRQPGRHAFYWDVSWGRDFAAPAFADLRLAKAGDACPRCGAALELWRGIEVGHVFKLGTKYSAALGATVLDDQGQERDLFMGCYGIGVGRTVAAAIEQNHDRNGIVFPLPIAPFQVLITVVNPREEEVLAAANDLYRQLEAAGIEVLLDDRDERPGSKFKDADLIGIPLRVTVGSRGLAEGAVELQERATGQRTMLPMADAARLLAEQVRAALG